MSTTKESVLAWIRTMDRDAADRMFSEYKVWAFRTAHKLMLRGGKPTTEAFALTIAWTADSADRLENISERELVGFRQWYEMFKRHNRQGSGVTTMPQDHTRTETFDIGISATLSNGEPVYVTADVTYRPPVHHRRWNETADGAVLDFTPHVYRACAWLDGTEVDLFLRLPSRDQQAVGALIEGYMETVLADMEPVDPQAIHDESHPGV